MRDKGIVSAAARDDERQFEAALRPQRLADFTGQSKLKENLSIAIEAARLRGEALDHVLLYGPPGLGKTTLATIIANELGAPFQQTAGPILQKKLDLTGILTTVTDRQVFFIDEIHTGRSATLDVILQTGPLAHGEKRIRAIPHHKSTL